MKTTKRHPQPAVRRWMTGVMLVALAVLLPNALYAQEECFEFEDDAKTIINGLTDTGKSRTELTIPASVTQVKEYAFSDTQASSLSLYIEGNPTFDEKCFDGKENKVAFLNLGSQMTASKMKTLIKRIGKDNQLWQIEIEGYSGENDFDWEEMGEYLSSEVRVVMPAELVDEQVFGNAVVFGRFNLQHSLSTFCCKQSFFDDNDGSNFLFYRAAELVTDNDGFKKLHIKREHVIVGGQGVLAHNRDNSSTRPELPRIWGNSKYSDYEEYTYNTNMLKGVLTPTAIQPTEGDLTNMILYEGTFYPTSGGTLGANRAYLQVPTSDLNDLSNLTLLFDNNPEEDAIRNVNVEPKRAKGWYSISGMHLEERPAHPGLYIHDGCLETIK